MATVARRLLLRAGVGERLLTTKLLILNGTGSRPTNIALSMLTGSIAVQRLVVADLLDVELGAEPLVLGLLDVADVIEPIVIDVEMVAEEIATPFHRSRHYSARTVYLSEHHLGDVDRIADAWQSIEPRRLSRSAVVRRAVDYLYAAVEADPAKFMLENE
jgi:hypothetical protein